MPRKDEHYIDLSPEELKKAKRKKVISYYLGSILGSVIYSIGVAWILQLCGFFSGGATGLAQLVAGIFGKYGTNAKLNNFLANNLGTIVMIINIPLLVFSWKGLSKKFALLTTTSIITQTIVLNLLSSFTVTPFVYFLKAGQEVIDAINNGGNVVGPGLFDAFKEHGFQFFKAASEVNPLVAEFTNSMLPGTRFLLAVIGGIVTGYGAAICLKCGGSTGGVDIISNYFQVKKKISFTKISALIDGTIIALSAIISVENVLFTLIRLLAYIKTVDATYNSYKISRIEIITDKVEEMRTTLLANIHHGMTIYQCIGGYTNQPRTSIVIYASRFEIPLYTKIIHEVDKNAFITVSKVDMKNGNYIQSTIA